LDTRKNKSSAQILSQIFFWTRKKKILGTQKKKVGAQNFYFDAQNHSQKPIKHYIAYFEGLGPSPIFLFNRSYLMIGNTKI
jgi:hypothetical protein